MLVKGLSRTEENSQLKGAEPDAVVVVLKAREPARIVTAIGDKAANRWHLQFAERWVVQYNFYVNDARWGAHVRARVPLPAVFGADLPQTSITGSRTACARRASTSGNAPTPLSVAPNLVACRSWPTN